MSFKYPVYQPSLNGNEKKYVLDCLDSTWISSKGKYITEFENKFAAYINIEHALGASNGTVALHLALLTLGITAEDEVIVPTLTYIASVNAIAYTGAKPVFVDSLPGSWQIDFNDVRKKITSKTKAIMAVHLYGHPCDMDELVAICKEYSIFLIEDAAEAFGTYYKGKHAGTFGDISIFSFFGNKTITTGEGGMVVMNDQTLYKRALHLRGQGLAQYREYWHDIIGYNYRMTNICAAIGVAQLEQADTFIEQKKKIAAQYKEELAGLPVEVHQESKDCVHSYWMVSILVKSIKDRDPLREAMKESGIETRPVFYPVHTMPMYSTYYQKHSVAEDIGWRGINLPSYPALSAEDVKYICGAIKKYFDR
jgi:perosamine synthetase